MRRPLALAIVVACACARAPAAPILRASADLDGDGAAEEVAVDPGRDPFLSVRRGPAPLLSALPRRWRPWRLALADVDGDGRAEIVVGVHKATRYFPFPHNCLFVYSFDGERLVPRWLGSSLARPFTDFAFADLDGDHADELVAVERLDDGRARVSVYSWAGFGFTSDSSQGSWRGVRLDRTSPTSIVVEADGERIDLARGPT
jgi:hypothetical protein